MGFKITSKFSNRKIDFCKPTSINRKNAKSGSKSTHYDTLFRP